MKVPVKLEEKQIPFNFYTSTYLGYLDMNVDGLKAGPVTIGNVEFVLGRTIIPNTNEPTLYLKKGDPTTLSNFYAEPLSDDRPDNNMK